MPNEAAMYWYKQEESKQALSKLETLLSQKTLTKPEDFKGVSDEAYQLLMKLPDEKRAEFKYLANIMVDYLSDCLDKTCLSGNPAQIAERAILRKKISDLQKMYQNQPCV
ncbi:MAG: hypothetical protein NTY99_00120 [DPANN group archaeon]|nr:hypothetical protein [DPANN group archaeon]